VLAVSTQGARASKVVAPAKSGRAGSESNEGYREAIDRLQESYREALAAVERANLAAMERFERQHREALALMVERIDAAELRAEVANRMLNDLVTRIMAAPIGGATPAPAARPWWARWFG
jgi:ribosomal protein L20